MVAAISAHPQYICRWVVIRIARKDIDTSVQAFPEIQLMTCKSCLIMVEGKANEPPRAERTPRIPSCSAVHARIGPSTQATEKLWEISKYRYHRSFLPCFII